jgi:hypothetical protein
MEELYFDTLNMLKNAEYTFVQPGANTFYYIPCPSDFRNIQNSSEQVLEDVNWIHLAQDRDRWQALVNTVMILLVP